ncbi:MAG: hypothetical protein U5M23_08495 [Marinagarivorans sp.]|nr:hypothetical protein [Marinagarivorans sp.]
MMTDILYAIPDDPAIRKVVITSLFESPQMPTVHGLKRQKSIF